MASRFIFIGTEAAFFTGHDLQNIDESIQYPNTSPYLYSRTKALAEQQVLQANSDVFQTISLRPRFVWGPGDQSVLPTLIEMVQKNKFAWIDQLCKSILLFKRLSEVEGAYAVLELIDCRAEVAQKLI